MADPAIVTSARKLCRVLGAPAAVEAEVDLAARTPARYLAELAERAERRGIRAPKDVRGTSLAVVALVDALEERGVVHVVDRKFVAEEIADSARALARRARVPLGRFRFERPDTPPGDVVQSLEEVGAALLSRDARLFAIVLPWDEYALFVVPKGRAKAIEDLAGRTLPLRAYGSRPPTAKPAASSTRPAMTTISLPAGTWEGWPLLADPYAFVAFRGGKTYVYDLRDPTAKPRVERRYVHHVNRSRAGEWLVVGSNKPAWDKTGAITIEVRDAPGGAVLRTIRCPEDLRLVTYGWVDGRVAAIGVVTGCFGRVWLEDRGVMKPASGVAPPEEVGWYQAGFVELEGGRVVLVTEGRGYEVHGMKLVNAYPAPPPEPRGARFLAHGRDAFVARNVVGGRLLLCKRGAAHPKPLDARALVRLLTTAPGPDGTRIVSPYDARAGEAGALLVGTKRIPIPATVFGRNPISMLTWMDAANAFVAVSNRGKIFVLPQAALLTPR